MYKIAVIGDKDSVSGYASVGMDVFEATDPKYAIKLLRRLEEESYGIIFITEHLASDIQSEVDRYSEKITPAVILIPGVDKNTGAGMKNLSRYVEQAVGSDILA